MSVVFAGNNSGSFVSTGASKLIVLRSGFDFMNVYNFTQMGTTQTPGRVVQSYWQYGMPQGEGLFWSKSNASNALNANSYAAGAFTLVNNTINSPGPSLSFTSVSAGTPPVVATANTGSLSNGDIVRLFNVAGGHELDGLDFTIGAISAGVSFTLAYMATIGAATAGTFRRIPYDSYWYPPSRVISKISNAVQAIVTLTVTHNFTVGQEVRFVIPTLNATSFGMTQLNLVQAAIVAIGQADANGVTNTITVDVDTTGFGAFVFPNNALAVAGFSPAQVIPIGENTAVALNLGQNILADATRNNGYLGMVLGGGAANPAGSAGDVIYWMVGKSFNGV